jgi:hypothetical protein
MTACKIPAVFTMDETAEKLRVSRTAMQDIVKRHPYYFANGHKKLFTEQHVLMIIDGLESETRRKCLSSSSPQKKAAPRSIAFAEPTSNDTWIELQRRLTKPKRGASSRPSPSKSNVVSLPSARS